MIILNFDCKYLNKEEKTIYIKNPILESIKVNVDNGEVECEFRDDFGHVFVPRHKNSRITMFTEGEELNNFVVAMYKIFSRKNKYTVKENKVFSYNGIIRDIIDSIMYKREEV